MSEKTGLPPSQHKAASAAVTAFQDADKRFADAFWHNEDRGRLLELIKELDAAYMAVKAYFRSN